MTNVKRPIDNYCTFLLVLAVQVIFLVQGSDACLWCDKRQEERFLNCLFIDVVNNPEFVNAPVSSVDEMKWSLLTTSDALKRTPNAIKWKLMDNVLVEETSRLTTTLSHYSGIPYDSVLETVVELSGNCFSAATGQNNAYFKSDLRRLVKDYNKNADSPSGSSPNSMQNNGMNNQNQPFPNNNQQIQQPSINTNNQNRMNPTGNNPSFNKGNVPPSNRPTNSNDVNGIRSTQQPTTSSNDGYGNHRVIPNTNTNSPSTNSPKTSSTAQGNSKPPNNNSKTSGGSTATSPAPKKEDGNGKVDEETCAMEFRKALYNKLVNDTKFTSVFGVVPYSSAKSLALQATKNAFKEYGAPQQEDNFSKLWTFESKSVPIKGNNKDFAEVLSKTIPIIFTRGHLLKEDDCEGQGKIFAEYILKSVPGHSNNNPSPTSGKQSVNSTVTQSPSKSDLESSSQSTGSINTDSKSLPDQSSKTDADRNSKNPKSKHHGKFSFGQFLKDIFGVDDSTEKQKKKEDSNDSSNFEDDLNESLSNTKSDYETIKNLKKLVSAANNCVTPTGFDYDKFKGAMSETTDSIQKNHPDWSQQKCQMKMYSLTVVAMSHALQELSSNNDNKENKPFPSDQSASQPNDLQGSNFNPPANVPPNFNNQGFIPPRDSTNLGPVSNFDPGYSSPPQMNSAKNAFINHGPERPVDIRSNNDNIGNFGSQNNPDYNTRFPQPETNMNNPPPFGIQPNPAYPRAEEPQEFRPQTRNNFDSNLANRNFENNPFPPNNPPVYNKPNYEPEPQIPAQTNQFPRSGQDPNSGFPNTNLNPPISFGNRPMQSTNSNLANGWQPKYVDHIRPIRLPSALF
ncbi:uncharacterized protein NPIL_257271 [Nephila pilipes]|uniref:Uncharacterized protein n=1 Tax=Nephila pilipes TaxID=299642 RepID=A0A8X6T7G4_NEPPI|nr:uncharacterized protein NPIL_257271 [Nephila pilipes]